MVFLSLSIVIALLITIALPIAVSFWLNRKRHVSWRVMLYGVLGYFIVQALVTLPFNGLALLVQEGIVVLDDPSLIVVQTIMSVLVGALVGVLVRWAGMKFVSGGLDTLEGGYGIGVGYGGAESIILTGVSLLFTFVSMVSNINIDPNTTTLDPEFVTAVQEAWQMSPLIPFAISIERLSAFVMHITVTILVLQVFKRQSVLWLLAAFGLELGMNGIIVGFAEADLPVGWFVLLSVIFLAVNLYLLYRIEGFEFFRGLREEKLSMETPFEDEA